jgi:hypothetical protein
VQPLPTELYSAEKLLTKLTDSRAESLLNVVVMAEARYEAPVLNGTYGRGHR